MRWVSLAGLAVVVVGVVLGVTLTGGGSAVAPAVGSLAPAGSFTSVSGQAETLSLRGQPTLVWLITTWCPVCQAGTRAMTARLASRLAQLHVRVLELELHGDLGHARPSMTAFVHTYAGAGPHGADWTFGMASSALTQAYNPKGVMDVYYLVDSTGHVRYVNSGPATTGSKLLAYAAALS
jgi:thiol-disulfide isomerase/thioredoxin